MRLGCTWNFPFISMRQVTSATAVPLGGIWMDLDSVSAYPSKFSSVSKTSLLSMYSFLVPCLVHPTVMTFGMVKSLPKMIDLLIFVHTMKEFVKVCSFIVKSYVVIPLVSMSWPVAPLRVGMKLVFRLLCLSFSYVSKFIQLLSALVSNRALTVLPLTTIGKTVPVS